VDYLTDLVEEAVYKEFEAISELAGVLGVMDTMYQRSKIQEQSLYSEHKKHDGSPPLVGISAFLPNEHAGEIATEIELVAAPRKRRASMPPTSPTSPTGSGRATRRRRLGRPRAHVWRMPMKWWRSRPMAATGWGICSRRRATAGMCLRRR